jgi:ribulose-phosphate 3-epimerase
MPKVAPSVLGADFSRLGDEISSAVEAGADLLHLDIMDGHFVPNISFGPAIVKTIDKMTNIFLDVHLMLTDPEKYFDPFIEAGADNITFHLEVHPEPGKYADQLHAKGVRAGISINPDMPVERVLPFLEKFDLLLIMSVFPGFGGQKFIDSAYGKVETARSFIDRNGLTTEIQVDGGVDSSNAAKLAQAGVDILVMGSAFFGSKDRSALIRSVRT